LFNAISVADKDDKLRLKEIHTGVDVLHAVRHFMDLAVGCDILATDLKELPTPSKIDPIYLSLELHEAESQTRLIELVSGGNGDPIRMNHFTVNNLSSQPYEAVSCVWGSPDADVTISVNGRPFSISTNLAQALIA
jgi:hypothetical protein